MTTDTNSAATPGSGDQPQSEESWADSANKDFDRFLGLADSVLRGDKSNSASNSTPTGDGAGKQSGDERPKTSETKSETTAPAPQASDGKTGTSDTGDSTDPLAKLSVDALLKHPTLGPQLNSWNDRTTNSRLQTERPRILQEQQFQEDKEYLESLSDAERGQVLSQDPALATTWARIQEANSRNANGNPEAVALQAQVYALGSEIRNYDAILESSDLEPEEKARLKDYEEFKGKGFEGFNLWSQRILSRLIEHEAEKKITTELESRWESFKNDREAQLPTRPGFVPGRSQAPRRDFRESSSHDFVDAFR